MRLVHHETMSTFIASGLNSKVHKSTQNLAVEVTCDLYSDLELLILVDASCSSDGQYVRSCCLDGHDSMGLTSSGAVCELLRNHAAFSRNSYPHWILQGGHCKVQVAG